MGTTGLPHDGDPRPAALADDGSSHLLLETGRVIRDNAPVLLALSLGMIAIALPCVMVASVSSWEVAWGPLVLLTTPVWVGALAAADRMLEGDAVSLRQVAGLVRRHAGAAWRLALVPALVGTGCLLLLARAAQDGPPPLVRWALLPALGGLLAVAVLIGPACVMAVRFPQHGAAPWQAAARLLVSRPVPVLGATVLGGLVVWLALVLGPAALVALGPLAVLLSAVTRPAPPGL